jgi:spore germination protein GerM
MSNSQKFGIICLIIITALYIYLSFFAKDGFKLPSRNQSEEDINPFDRPSDKSDIEKPEQNKSEVKTVKIYVTDSKGNLRSINRKCDTAAEKSCFAFAIKELISAPSDWEKSKKGLSSEIPSNTKILSIREGADTILIDLSSSFESGGGAESTDIRVRQLIKTVLANTKQPVYLYINGKQADVIGGEGIMIKQPLSEKSLDD